MKRLLGLLFVLTILYACGNAPSDSGGSSTGAKPETTTKADDGKGVGAIKSVALNDPLDQALVEKGRSIYELKCAACHKLTDMRVVGPGYKGITKRRKPEWIMNMILHTDAMLAEDPTAQALLEECLTRMPNQNLTEEDARAVLEFMFANDQE
ncbi:MAG: cytochrome c [Saprospiraceae bacterium]|nr:cytochrome c [Lewinella sp.]